MSSPTARRHNENQSHNPDTDGNHQSSAGNAPLGEEDIPRLRSLCRVRIIHYRNRLIDPDNLNAKAAIDRIVELGILGDDSAQQVAEVTHTQIKSSEEKTVIEIEEIGATHAH